MKKLILSLITFFLLCSTAISKDLSGNVISCKIGNDYTGHKELFAIEFISKKEARLSNVITRQKFSDPTAKVLYLVKNEIVKYDVKDLFILVRDKRFKSESETNFGDDWDHTEIWRENLWLGGARGGHVQGRGEPEEGTDNEGCKLIDIKIYDPFKIIDDFQLTPDPKIKKIL